MSRVGKVPIKIPKGVEVKIGPDMVLTLKGPKGQAVLDTQSNVAVSQKEGALLVERKSDEQNDRAYHGLYHRLLSGALHGVTQGYSKELDMIGVGYKAEVKGKDLYVSVGLSHQVRHQPAAGITIACPNPTRIVITGPDKQLVGQTAAKIRSIAPPEPYKGKGIRYVGEVVRKKVGKTGAAATGAPAAK